MTRPPARLDRPWARSPAAAVARELILAGLLGPLSDLHARRRVEGTEHLGGVAPPVIFAANHASHADTPTILRALPGPWRRRTAVAAAADYFYTRPWLAQLVSLAFNTVAVARKGEHAGDAAGQLARLLGEGWSLLVFAEGTRSRDGTVGRLRSGAALLAAEHGLAIVPVHVAGTHALMPPGRAWPRRTRGRFAGPRHEVTVRFGPPIRPRPGEHRTEVMERVRVFLEDSGATTTPDRRVEARRRAAAPGA